MNQNPIIDNNAFIGKTVKIKKVIFEDGYLEEGMLAVVNNIRTAPSSIDLPKVIFNLKDFHEHNIKLERADYYDSNHNACLTASQYGAYPKNHIDSYYFENGENLSEYLEIIEDPLNTPAMMLDTLKMVYNNFVVNPPAGYNLDAELARRLAIYRKK